MTSNIFIPTYLYVKQHSITGKLYFGKTTKNPEIYSGSGTHWKRHIAKYGKEYVETLWYCLFLDAKSITSFSLNFSRQENIVESKSWLNLRLENGIDGIVAGSIPWNKGLDSSDPRVESYVSKMTIIKKEQGYPSWLSTEEVFIKLRKPKKSKQNYKYQKSEEHKQNMRKPKSKTHSENISMGKKGKKPPQLTCPHCNKIGGGSVMYYHHFDNCKSRKSTG